MIQPVNIQPTAPTPFPSPSHSSNRVFNPSTGVRTGAASSSTSLLVVEAEHRPAHAFSSACRMDKMTFFDSWLAAAMCSTNEQSL